MAQKRAKLLLSLALRHPMAELDGRRIVQEGLAALDLEDRERTGDPKDLLSAG